MEPAAQVLVKIEPWDTESVEDAPSSPVFIKVELPSDGSVEVRSSCLDVYVKQEILNTEASCSNAMEIPLDETVKEECGGPAVSPSAAAPSSPVLLKVKPLSDGSVEFWFSCMDEPAKEKILNTETSCSNGIETPLDEIVEVKRVKEECGVSASVVSEGLYDGHAVTGDLMQRPIPVELRNIKTEGRAPQKEPDKRPDTYRCEHCSFTTTRKCGLGGHMRIHARHNTPVCKTEHTEKPNKSDKRTATARKSNLLVHKREHTGEKPYKCSQCSFSAVTKAHLISHVLTHTGEKPFKCDQCSFIGKGKYGLQAHKRVHEKPYKCGQCSYASNYGNDLKRHERTHVREKEYRMYRCDQCKYFASSKQSVNLHRRNVHTEKTFKCSLCSYSTALEYSLLMHKKRHTGENQYKCRKCSFTTPRESELISHEIMHIGKQPHKSDDKLSNGQYKCSQCNFTTIVLSGLKCHENIHRREKRNKCGQDRVASSDNNKLSDHEEIHTEASSTSTSLTVEHEDS